MSIVRQSFMQRFPVPDSLGRKYFKLKEESFKFRNLKSKLKFQAKYVHGEK